ncbi:MAG: DUF63 family protein [Candidatus Aenigmatarchaeota archaeon]|nr:DUF63 family protein [Candidatus Aenigmarchaeota archaeon]
MDIAAWIMANYIVPLCKYYTPAGTLTYGLILVVAVAGLYKLLQKLHIKIDRNFFLGLLPFIIYGGWTRALHDHGLGIYGSGAWWWCSPPIYFLIAGVALASLFAGILLQKHAKIKYYYVLLIVGAALLIYNITLTTISNLFAVGIIAALVGFFAAVFFGFHYFRPKLLSLENAGIVVAHMLDASSSFVAIQFFGYYEQHVLPSFLIGLTGPWIMFPLKMIVVLAVLLAIDKYSDDKFFNNFLKIVILILGLALGVRDFLTVGMLAV